MGIITTRVKRGMVFMCDLGRCENVIRGTGSSLEGKTRPVVVVSNDAGNSSSSMANVIPITTREEVKIPVQIKFEYSNKSQVILTEQIRTVPQGSLERYLYTFSDEMMNEIEKKLMMQFSIRHQESLENVSTDVLSKLENVVKRIIENKTVEAQKQAAMAFSLDDLALKLGSLIEDLFQPTVNATPAPSVKKPTTVKPPITPDEKPISKVKLDKKPQLKPEPNTDNIKPVGGTSNVPVNKVGGKVDPQKPTPELTDEERKRREFQFDLDGRRNKISPEMYFKFFKESYEYSLDEMQCRYNITSKTDLYAKRFKVKKKLIGAGYDMSKYTK